jgi:hypothetical protein
MKIYQLENGRYVVAEYNEKNGQYTAPMNERERKVTGCHTYFAGNLEGLGVHSYSTKLAAKRWAEAQEIELEV